MATAILLCAIVPKVKAQSSFSVNEYSIDLKNYPTYTESQIQSAIASVKSSEFYDFHYVNSGCNFKSHYVSLWLKKKFNIETFKVWNFAKNMFYYSGYGLQLSVNDPNRLTESGRIFWGFHVAVGVLVSSTKDNKTSIDTLVIDLPTDENNPIPLRSWLNAQNQPNSYFTFTDRKYCDFETIVPAYYQNNELKQLSAIKAIFAGSFYNDIWSVSKDGPMAKALATDLIVMKYFREVVLQDSQRRQLVEYRQQLAKNIREKLKGQMSEAKIQEEIQKQEQEASSRIKERTLVLTAPIADYGNLKLPVSYNNQFPDLTAKIQKHLDDLTK